MENKDNEFWDVVDINGHSLNKKIEHKSPLGLGEYHLYVDIWVINKQGKILLTLRAPDKKTAPLKWENTGGSVFSNEKPITGAVRELYEETGIIVREEDLHLIGKHTYNNTISYIYMYKCYDDVVIIRLAPRETIDYKWASYKEVEQMIIDNKLVPEIREKFYSVIDKLKHYTQ